MNPNDAERSFDEQLKALLIEKQSLARLAEMQTCRLGEQDIREHGRDSWEAPPEHTTAVIVAVGVFCEALASAYQAQVKRITYLRFVFGAETRNRVVRVG